jgi:hypothetical protein
LWPKLESQQDIKYLKGRNICYIESILTDLRIHKNPSHKITKGARIGEYTLACLAPDEDPDDAPDEYATTVTTSTAYGLGPMPNPKDIA